MSLLPEISRIVGGVSLGNGRILLMLNPNILNNLTALFAVETLFPSETDISLDWHIYRDTSSSYIRLKVGMDVEDDEGNNSRFDTALTIGYTTVTIYNAALGRDYTLLSDEELGDKWLTYADKLFGKYDLALAGGGVEVPLTETTASDLTASSTIKAYYPDGSLLATFAATDTFSRNIAPSGDYTGWIDVANLQIAVEASVGLALNSNLTHDIDLTQALTGFLFLGDTDNVSLELDNSNTATDYPDAKFRLDVGMALDLTDSQGTELRLEIVKEYKVAGQIKNYLLLGLYYVNRDGSLYLSVPALDINGIKVSNLDLSGVLSGMVGINWREALAGAEDEDKTFGLLLDALDLDLSVVADYIDKLVAASQSYVDGEGNVIKASLALAMGNNQIGLAVNFALIRLVMQYATDMGWLNLDSILGIADVVDDMIGLDRVE
jgi:hypothetical protein